MERSKDEVGKCEWCPWRYCRMNIHMTQRRREKKNKEKWVEKEKRLLTQLNTESDQIRWTQKN